MKGQIVEWNDSKGYGFISSLNGELRVFIHVSSVSNSGRRPRLNDNVVYEVAEDNKGRYNAQNVVIQGANGFPFPVLFGFSFLVAACASVVVLDGERLFIPVYIALSILTYLMFEKDKRAAENGRWRTKEETLHLLSLLGGWPGALFAQFTLRHKSRKQPFKFVLWVMVILNSSAFVWSFSHSGRVFIGSLLGNL